MKSILEIGEREMSAKIKVDCYAGYKANETPLTLSLGKKRLKVTDILDQWYGPDHTYFKVLAEDANIYILRYSEAHDVWNVVYFKDGGYHGEISLGMHRDASA
jgi:hypothetical protein